MASRSTFRSSPRRASREQLAFSVWAATPIHSSFARLGGGSVLFGATLALSEPLTALLRSAQSWVSSSRSLCKRLRGHPDSLRQHCSQSARSLARPAHRRHITRGDTEKPVVTLESSWRRREV